MDDPFTAQFLVYAGVISLALIAFALSPAFKFLVRIAVRRTIASLRRDIDRHEATIAKYQEIFEYIEEGLRTGQRGASKKIGDLFVTVTSENWTQYKEYLAIEEAAREESDQQLRKGVSILEKLEEK